MVKISVIMSIYNEPEEWILLSIESILNQSFTDFEFIIINDNPIRIENSIILDKYLMADKRIIIINNKTNCGLTKSLNKGLDIAKGTYIARMDADDISMLNRFQLQIDFMDKNKEYIVCGTQIKHFGDSVRNKMPWLRETDKLLKANLIWGSVFAHPTVFIRKSVLDEFSIRYNEDYKHAQDYRLWVDLFDKGKFYNIQKVCLAYRKSNTQISAKRNNSQLALSRISRISLIQKISELLLIPIELPQNIDFDYIRNLHFKDCDSYLMIPLLKVLIISQENISFNSILWILRIEITMFFTLDLRSVFRMLKNRKNDYKIL